ncbi:unnamed protein product [Ambrosiozyma monospora]|uniref:Unnamed protein product n=1 Tax=Ambrosiozyma monospora TaxID=43982 RepID=A0ACB5TP25_AMBMO|nr:unnamed protein product [Ambrosiozyma monospora]
MTRYKSSSEMIIVIVIHIACLAVCIPPLYLCDVDNKSYWTMAVGIIVGSSLILSIIAAFIQENRIIIIHSFFAVLSSDILLLVGFMVSNQWFFAGSFIFLSGSFPFVYFKYRNCPPLLKKIEMNRSRKLIMAFTIILLLLSVPFLVLPLIWRNGSWVLVDIILLVLIGLLFIKNVIGIFLRNTVYHIFVAISTICVFYFSLLLFFAQLRSMNITSESIDHIKYVKFHWLIWMKIPVCVSLLACFILNMKLSYGSLDYLKNSQKDEQTSLELSQRDAEEPYSLRDLERGRVIHPSGNVSQSTSSEPNMGDMIAALMNIIGNEQKITNNDKNEVTSTAAPSHKEASSTRGTEQQHKPSLEQMHHGDNSPYVQSKLRLSAGSPILNQAVTPSSSPISSIEELRQSHSSIHERGQDEHSSSILEKRLTARSKLRNSTIIERRMSQKSNFRKTMTLNREPSQSSQHQITSNGTNTILDRHNSIWSRSQSTSKRNSLITDKRKSQLSQLTRNESNVSTYNNNKPYSFPKPPVSGRRSKRISYGLPANQTIPEEPAIHSAEVVRMTLHTPPASTTSSLNDIITVLPFIRFPSPTYDNKNV